MGKRKIANSTNINYPNAMDISNSSDEDQRDVDEATDDNLKDEESVEIDFDFYDPKKIDFHSIKNLLNQLFSSDSELFNLSELTDLIIEQPLVGSTVKVDGSESDPYAILTVLNMKVHKERQCMKSIVNYLLEKSKKDSRLNDLLTDLFKENKHDVGLILSERLINMPVQLIPPMYKMLKEEIQWAVDDNEPYEFEWYLIISKTYREVASTIDEEMNVQGKRKKKAKLEPTIFYFHAEDEIIEQNTNYQLNFKFTKQPEAVSDSRRTFTEFGIEPAMKLFLIHKSNFDKLIQDLENACK
ncbi:hypothetical protein Glove_330g62 [Diversispora epigaea]|uniref:Protein BCP1 n=1 Tax=Diversispora epigaea TaxID=1348612 RepID=A0A397HJY1_9GLOM|nr:hypothetical protein Glove_330g62 [Diversispora epigaea]